MRIVIALGGNALLKRGEALTAENQTHNISRAVSAMRPIIENHEVIITHGNGPQVGLLSLQSNAYDGDHPQGLDVLGAETEGMIGYLIERELNNALNEQSQFATLLTQVLVDRDDPAFEKPTKPIGPYYDKVTMDELKKMRGWQFQKIGDKWRRVVPSPAPKAIMEARTIELLMRHGITVICAGGGGIPVIETQTGGLVGVDAVIDKDHASALLARLLGADCLMLLTDVSAVELDYGTPQARQIKTTSPQALLQYPFEAGSMKPKVEAACGFVNETGKTAIIGSLDAASTSLTGATATTIRINGSPDITFLDTPESGDC